MCDQRLLKYACSFHVSFSVNRLGLTPCSDGSRAARGVRVLITYLLTPWSRVLLEQIIGFQLIQKFLAFYGNQKFISAFTRTRHLSPC